MKIEFAFFESGATKDGYGLDFEMPAVPQHGDIIVVRRPETVAIYPEETFVVRRTEWMLRSPVSENPEKAISQRKSVGDVGLITVECERIKRGQ